SLNPPNPSLSAPSRHANHILEVVRRGIAADTPERITGSWSRCVRQYGLDPLRPHIPPILDKHAVEERRARVSDIVECAGAEMCSLYEQLGDSDAAVILTDAEGVILNIVCSRELGQELSSLGLRIGAVWSEAEAGTNGMGTCIAARAPVAVRQSEHFFASYSPLTCSAVPIYDPAGSIAAVLDITTRSQLPQQYALALAGMAAQRVENRIMDLRFGDAYPIRFHSQPELVHTLQEGKLVVGHDGMVRAANRSALAQLGFRSMRDATSRKVEE